MQINGAELQFLYSHVNALLRDPLEGIGRDALNPHVISDFPAQARYQPFIDLKNKTFTFMKRKSGALERRDPVGGSVGGRVAPDRLRAKTTGIFASTVNAP